MASRFMQAAQNTNRRSYMSKKGYLIGEVSSITGITRETLRYYYREGIVSPSYVDPSNNYRYYTYDQFWCFDIIVVCRRLGVSLERIKEILNSHDNNKVVELLLAEREEAVRLSQEYAKIADDISWYSDQQEIIRNTRPGDVPEIRYIPERKVLMGTNRDERRSYHLDLQELCRKAGQPLNALRRRYGFVLDPEAIRHDGFEKIGEYIQFEDEDLEKVPDHYITTIPGGEYACFVQMVVNDSADFSPILKWLKDNGRTASYIISDEVGLQLFQYLDHGYLCETKVLLDS